MLDDGSGGTWQLGTDGSRPVASRLTIRHSCCAASAPPPPRSQGRPGSVLPVCQLLLEVPALPQELSTGGYYPDGVLEGRPVLLEEGVGGGPVQPAFPPHRVERAAEVRRVPAGRGQGRRVWAPSPDRRPPGNAVPTALTTLPPTCPRDGGPSPCGEERGVAAGTATLAAASLGVTLL